MKKQMNIAIVVFAAFTAFAAVAARADYLYWQITQTETPLIEDYWNNALLETTDGDILQMAVATDGATGATWAQLDGYEAKSFFIELINYDESMNTITTVGYSATYSYAQLANYIVSSSAFPLPTISAAWMPTISPVPEPTSGMLFLLGIAALSLRRKRK